MRKLTQYQRSVLEECNSNLLLLLEAEEVNSDDEQPDHGEPSEQENNQPEQEQEEPMTQEELMAVEFIGTEDKFVQFVLYEKIIDLSSKLEILRESIKDDMLNEKFNILSRIDQYIQYVDVLNELIFTINTEVVYKIIGQIELELIDLLTAYNNELVKKEDK
ncbi:MAG: hypothetical protein WC136_00810 [Sphaerochaeta sp.]|jgi:hypothetical protein